MNPRAEEDARIASILQEQAGLSIASVFDLVNSKEPYPQAISALLECLPHAREKWIKEGIVRALSVKEAIGKAGPALVKEFKAILPDDKERQSLKWAIGNALSIVGGNDVADDLFEIVQDVRHGKSREMVVISLGRSSDPRAPEVLLKLLEEDEVCGQAIMAITRLKVREAIPKIQKLREHIKPWVRKEAEKAILKLES